MSEEGFDFTLAHLQRMPLAMEDDESLDPLDIGILGADAVMQGIAADPLRRPLNLGVRRRGPRMSLRRKFLLLTYCGSWRGASPARRVMACSFCGRNQMTTAVLLHCRRCGHVDENPVVIRILPRPIYTKMDASTTANPPRPAPSGLSRRSKNWPAPVLRVPSAAS